MNENWTEKLIDAHLEEPNTTEPSLRFESRVLAHLADQRTTRKRPVLWMAWAAAAAAAAIIAIVFLTPPVPKPPQVKTAKNATPAYTSATKSAELEVGKALMPIPALRRHSISNRGTIAASYQDEFFGGAATSAFFQASPTAASAFPSASPLTDEERMLLTMVGRMSGTQKRALVEALEASRIPDAEPASIPESNLRPAVEIKNTH